VLRFHAMKYIEGGRITVRVAVRMSESRGAITVQSELGVGSTR
jgi:hypothetical protein